MDVKFRECIQTLITFTSIRSSADIGAAAAMMNACCMIPTDTAAAKRPALSRVRLQGVHLCCPCRADISFFLNSTERSKSVIPSQGRKIIFASATKCHVVMSYFCAKCYYCNTRLARDYP
jgi:hypothetical protein